MTAPDVTPVSIWCGAVHPTAYLVICRRVRHSVEVLHSPTETGLDDWAEPSRVAPPTTSNEETVPGARATGRGDGSGASLRGVGGTSG